MLESERTSGAVVSLSRQKRGQSRGLEFTSQTPQLWLPLWLPDEEVKIERLRLENEPRLLCGRRDRALGMCMVTIWGSPED